MLSNYQYLSQYYDQGWGNFASQYLQFINPYLEKRKLRSASVLDLACGTGKLVLELAQAGHNVYGIDLSAEMIEVAREKTSGLSGVRFAVQNMLEFEVEGKFDLVTCTFDSINYLLESTQVVEFFKRVKQVLAEGGIFIFDANTEQMYLKNHQGTHVKEIGEESFTIILDYDRQDGIASTRFEFVDGVEVHRQRAYSMVEMQSMLEEAGFGCLQMVSNFKGEPATEGSERIFYCVEV